MENLELLGSLDPLAFIPDENMIGGSVCCECACGWFSSGSGQGAGGFC